MACLTIANYWVDAVFVPSPPDRQIPKHGKPDLRPQAKT